uniref:Mitogen-activated protein kinase kinase kinase ANP1 n=1 Tax=Nosema pernyi TaxID=1112939 RepID=A0A0N7ABK6_9MICR|nr:mitogen-activated protein kinase kinase kinase ANP1 [Nosema pernyi]
MPTKYEKLNIYYILKMGRATQYRLRYYIRRYYKKFVLSILLLSVVVILTFFILFTNKIFSSAKRASMEKEIYNYINKTMDEILKHKTRVKQNSEFAKLDPPLPIQPLKMTLSTAVFLYTDTTPNTVLKRIIVNKKAPIYEDEIALRLNHPNMVKSIKSERTTYEDSNGEKQIIIWLYMEYLPIRISYKTVNKNEDVLRRIARDVLIGLDYLHKQNIAHLDLKIANIMGDHKKGEIFYKIIDFGYARHMKNGEIKIPTKNYGTFPYKPPEIVLHNIHSLKSDIWCLGAIILFLRNGKTPFYDSKGNKQSDKYKDFIKGNRTIPLDSEASKEIKDFITSCLQLDKDRRPTAKELLSHKFITGTEDGIMFHSTSEEDSDYYSDEETLDIDWL